MDIVVATRNRNKVREIESIFREMDSDVRLYTLNDFPEMDEVEEDGATFKENAVKKAVQVSRTTGKTAIADDSGLEVDALDGAPGVYSARYGGENADDRMNNERLLREMQGVPPERRTARFVCCIALAAPEGVRTFRGRVEGMVGTEQKGRLGFGYDPLFYPEGADRTFAEMNEDEKNAVSHRSRALQELQAYLRGRKTRE